MNYSYDDSSLFVEGFLNKLRWRLVFGAFFGVLFVCCPYERLLSLQDLDQEGLL